MERKILFYICVSFLGVVAVVLNSASLFMVSWLRMNETVSGTETDVGMGLWKMCVEIKSVGMTKCGTQSDFEEQSSNAVSDPDKQDQMGQMFDALGAYLGVLRFLSIGGTLLALVSLVVSLIFICREVSHRPSSRSTGIAACTLWLISGCGVFLAVVLATISTASMDKQNKQQAELMASQVLGISIKFEMKFPSAVLTAGLGAAFCVLTSFMLLCKILCTKRDKYDKVPIIAMDQMEHYEDVPISKE